MDRLINPVSLLAKRSHFLLGPRGTGKSYLIRQAADGSFDTVDLLHSATYLDLVADPSRLEQYITCDRVVIDEVQRVPELLNEVHRLIEERQIRFLLTGSSARKLRRAGVNLLAGRAFPGKLFGLTWREISREQDFDLERYLLWGGLPTAYLQDDPGEYLHAYTDTYLKQEIQAEALVKKLPNYVRFLTTAAHGNAQMLNFTKIANDAQLRPNTVRDYYQLLEDTLVGQTLPAWRKSTKRKAIHTAKFYFFDPGVAHSIGGIQSLDRHSDLYGRAFEHFVYCEIRSALSYLRCRKPLCYWRSKSGMEVDFLIGDDVAVEVKASSRISERDHKGLRALAEEGSHKTLLVVSQDETTRTFPSGIRHLHWATFFERLWDGEYFGEAS